MSDSYSAWREEREENSEKYEKLKDHFEKIKDTKEFKEKLRNAEKEFKSFKFTACKRCFNCKHFSSDYTDSYGDTINLCFAYCTIGFFTVLFIIGKLVKYLMSEEYVEMEITCHLCFWWRC